MYLRTPRRYLRGQKRSIISFRWLWLWIVTPLVLYVGVELYNNRSTYAPHIERAMAGLLAGAESSLATAMAPTPLPTVNPSERLNAANAAWARGSIDEAVNLYRDVLNAVPNDVNVHYFYAFGLAISGKLKAALEAAERTITANPYAPDAWAIRSMVLTWSDRPNEAIASAQRALELASEDNLPSRARATAFLAEALFDAGQYDRALSTVERALEIYPDSFEAHRVRSLIMQGYRFDFAAALKDSQAAYDLAPNLPYLGIDLAVLQIREGKSSEGLSMLQEIIELNPQNTRALWWAGVVYLNTVGDPNQASDLLSRCVEVAPENINCLYSLGRTQIRLEQYNAAADTFQKVINLGTNDPYHYWWAGRAQVLTAGCPAAVGFLQAGWQIAQNSDDQVIIDSYVDQMRSCQMIVDIPDASAPEATEDAGS